MRYSPRQPAESASGNSRIRPTTPSFKVVYRTGSAKVLTPKLLMNTETPLTRAAITAQT